MKNASVTTQAIVLMLVAMVCFSAMTVAIRGLGESMHSTQIVLLRNLVSLALIVGWTFWLYKGKPNFKTNKLKSHFWRGTFGIGAMQLWFYSLTIMPVTLATALSYTAPIFTAIIAILFLGEKAGWRRWSAIIFSFVGVWVILRPDTGAMEASALIVLAASFLMAISGVMVKTLTKTESPETIIFYMSLFMIGWSIAPAIPNWDNFTLPQFGIVVLISLFSTAAHLCMTRAFVRTDMVVLMPFDFTRLIFTALLAYAFFGEQADGAVWWGAGVMVLATIYIAHREAVNRRKNKEKAAQEA